MLFQLFKKMPSISARELQSRLSRGITLLGVRTPSEYRAGYIPQAINVSLNKIPVYDKSTNEVYVICQFDMRSKNATGILARKNYHMISVHGGVFQ